MVHDAPAVAEPAAEPSRPFVGRAVVHPDDLEGIGTNGLPHKALMEGGYDPLLEALAE